jgi:phosphoenolpyruvate carboxylase
MRKIPTTMATQHPDHASVPYWHTQAYIRTQEEVFECFHTFSELGVDEYKWDWEGKFVDESVVERLLSDNFDYFQKHPLGKEKFLTFRLPNPKVETEFRLGRALMALLTAAGLAKQVGLHSPPMFEVILPMTETAEEIVAVQQAFHELTSLKHPLLKFEVDTLDHIHMIPLFEQVDVIKNSAEIVGSYIDQFKSQFGKNPPYMRPYVARSDPTLNSGNIATVLAIKIALSRYAQFEKDRGINMYPIIGAAALPFRGGITPEHVDSFVHEYAGIRTTLLQSAFRYDYPKKQVLKGIQRLNELLPKSRARHIDEKHVPDLERIMKISERYYRGTVEGIAEKVNEIAQFVPKRRERVQHIGLFGYFRGVGSVQLPRAIKFTGSLYSIGIPPELIGTGRTIRDLREKGDLPLLEEQYLNLRSDLERVSVYVNKENVEALATKHGGPWEEIREDIREIETYIGRELGPRTKTEKAHASIARIILELMGGAVPPDILSKLIEEAGILRKSIG